MPTMNRKLAVVAAAVALSALVGAGIWMAVRPEPVGQSSPPSVGTQNQSFHLTQVQLAGAPEAVRRAATALMESRVGYAMQAEGQTYLIISTGSEALRARIDGAAVQPASGAPEFVDVNLSTAPAGDRLIVARTAVGAAAEYQFNLDGVTASIPTLRNPHHLPLITLPQTGDFALVKPEANVLLSGQSLTVQGYARVFEAQFTMRLVSAKGRVLAEQHVMAAAGGPWWGSFSAELGLEQVDLPETGFLILEEGMSEARLVLPVRFRTPQQMG